MVFRIIKRTYQNNALITTRSITGQAIRALYVPTKRAKSILIEANVINGP